MSITTEERQGTGWTADASTFGARLALIRQRMGWGNIAKAAGEVGEPGQATVGVDDFDL